MRGESGCELGRGRQKWREKQSRWEKEERKTESVKM